jgi:hypothetical protein
MQLAHKTVFTSLVILAVFLACSRLLAEPPPSGPGRQAGQSHGRMVCIKTEGKKFVFVNMPGHYDLGAPSISPDGRWVVFDGLTIGKQPVRESWLVGIDGRGLKKLAKGAAPRWSPDGKRILFTRVQRGRNGNAVGEKQTVVELELATGKDHEIVEGRFGDWSPDGTQIAFAREGQNILNSEAHAGSKIFVAKANGGDPTELADGDWPSWSPDGKSIACCAQEEGALPQMCVIDLKTRKSELIGTGFCRGQWSSDGRSFCCNGFVVGPKPTDVRRAPARLWLDGSKIEFVFLDKDMSSSPCVSRDGKTLALIVDSEDPARPLDEMKDEEEEEKLGVRPPINPGG